MRLITKDVCIIDTKDWYVWETKEGNYYVTDKNGIEVFTGEFQECRKYVFGSRSPFPFPF